MDTIRNHTFFAGLDGAILDYLENCATEREVSANEVLFRFDDPADRFYVVVSGEITVEVAAIEGPPLELQLLGPGKILGWSWLIPPYRWSFQARAVTPSTVIEFDGAAILLKCEQDPVFGYALMKRFSGLMSDRLTAARRRMMEEWRPAGFA